MTPTILVHGGRAQEREKAIAIHLDPSRESVVIAEGLPSGGELLEGTRLQVLRIAPGCMCCTGNLTMRVTLNRVLRKPPQQLFLSLANALHLAQIRKFLQDDPYRDLLQLTEELDCEQQPPA